MRSTDDAVAQADSAPSVLVHLGAPSREADPGLPAAGCYVLEYTSSADAAFALEGTLRVEYSTGAPLASGDLYERQLTSDGEFPPARDPADGIPTFPLANYRFYLKVNELSPTDDGFRLSFEAFRFSPTGVVPLSGRPTIWPVDGSYCATLARNPDAPMEQSYQGEVTGNDGETVGRLSMAWASAYLRKAIIEIDRVPHSEVPLNNGMGVSWRSIFDAVGWDMGLEISDDDIPEPSRPSWAKPEAHAVLHARRNGSNLDAEWRYHILAVRFIEYVPAERGWMYDEVAGFPNRVAREGLMVASHWTFPDEEMWGLVRGQRAGTTVTYFRTAVHELGHALGLEHSEDGNHFMVPTPTIAKHASNTPGTPFPSNITWAYSPEDVQRLRHWPDVIVRPSALSAHAGQNSPVFPSVAARV